MRTDQESTLGLRSAIGMGTPKAVELWLEVVDDPEERSRQIAALQPADRGRLGELLESGSATELFTHVDLDVGARVLKRTPAEAAGRLIGDLETPLAVGLLRRLDGPVAEAVLAATDHERAALLRGQLSWPQDSVAAHMEPDTLAVRPATTVSEAVDQIRAHVARNEASDSGHLVYATDGDGVLVGAVRLRRLVLAPATATIGDLIGDDPVTVAPLTDVEEAANLLIDRKLDELPVVDENGRLLGVLLEDDAVDVLERETTEDAEKQGGSEPLDVPYLRASPWLLWRKRIVWLLVLFVAEAYTGTVLRAFEEEMEAVVALAFFIPLLIGTGGNTGTQITTTLVRAMGTGQVRFRDLPAIVTKEMTTGFLVAIAMATAAMIRAWTLGVGPEVTLTVCLTVAAIVLWSSLISSVLPMVLKKCKVDPAVVSAPMIATIVDGTGLMIYFWIAHLTLPQLAGL
jgi:magnesium transporter